MRGLVVLLMGPCSALALSMNRGPKKPPAMLPELDLIPPTFWEQHGLFVAAASVGGAALLGLAIWWWRRPKPGPVEHPEVAARLALRALAGRTEDAFLAGEVARHLRHFVNGVLKRLGVEWTADELEDLLRRRSVVDPALAQELVALFRECEARAFAAVPPAPRAGLVRRALELAERLEASLAPPAPSVPASPAASAAAANPGSGVA